jgi:hypothetical protein
MPVSRCDVLRRNLAEKPVTVRLSQEKLEGTCTGEMLLRALALVSLGNLN